jgi:hypothetical protein
MVIGNIGKVFPIFCIVVGSISKIICNIGKVGDTFDMVVNNWSVRSDILGIHSPTLGIISIS